MKIFYDRDAEPRWLQGKTVAIIGYGSQGHAHANNLRDSGVKVIVGLRRDGGSWAKAEQAGLDVRETAAAAKAAGVEVKSTDLITRGAALPEIGVSGAVEDAVFALKAGETTGPISTENAVVVARVKERQDINPAEMHTARDAVRNELLQSRRSQFFAAYMSKAKGKMQVEYNTEAIKALLGSM